VVINGDSLAAVLSAHAVISSNEIVVYVNKVRFTAFQQRLQGTIGYYNKIVNNKEDDTKIQKMACI
jgi:hypothetical protein